MKRFAYTAPRYLAPTGEKPPPGGFVVGIYGVPGNPFVAVGDARVERFTAVDTAPDQLFPLPADLCIEVPHGAVYPYGFERSDGTVVFGPYEEVCRVVREEVPLLRARPFILVGLSLFIGDEALFNEAHNRCVELIRWQSGDEAAERYRLNNGNYHPFIPQ